MTPHCTQHIRAVKKCKHFIRAFISRTFSAVRIDMVHEQGDIFLCQAVKRSSFWKDIPYELMVLLSGAFLSQ